MVIRPPLRPRRRIRRIEPHDLFIHFGSIHESETAHSLGSLIIRVDDCACVCGSCHLKLLYVAFLDE